MANGQWQNQQYEQCQQCPEEPKESRNMSDTEISAEQGQTPSPADGASQIAALEQRLRRLERKVRGMVADGGSRIELDLQRRLLFQLLLAVARLLDGRRQSKPFWGRDLGSDGSDRGETSTAPPPSRNFHPPRLAASSLDTESAEALGASIHRGRRCCRRSEAPRDRFRRPGALRRSSAKSSSCCRASMFASWCWTKRKGCWTAIVFASWWPRP